ncbi:hypothetical protein TNCV_2201171 [Trichonephila clavipes]|uniref:Ig-like domain-containing protein n=1 Tax=Trichonephila clavipes TaxID=2585209 RepID=A0A8X6SCJ0_TRICX|nr:hypothetical protein TNCV_2201171 [Trichonephila clavipes]
MIAREGTNITLKCAAKGRPQPKLSWRREDYKRAGTGIWRNNNLAQSCPAPFNLRTGTGMGVVDHYPK